MSETDPLTPRVVWTEAARKLLRPRRGNPVKRARSAADLLETVREAFRARRKLFVVGQAKAEPEVAPLLRAVAARIEKDAPLGAEAAAAGLVLLGEPFEYRGAGLHEALIDLWAEAHGLPFAVEAAALSLSFSREPTDGYGATAIWVARCAPALPDRYGRYSLGPWEPLRAAVARASELAYAEARSTAEGLRRDAPLLVRALLSFAFPGEDAWSRADAVEALGEGNDPSPDLVCLLASLRDADAAARMVDALRGAHGSELVEMSLELVENLGAAAEGPLLRLNEDLSHPWMQVGEVQHASLALAQIQSQKVAAFFAAHLDHKHLRAAASDYFQRAPGLAIRALAPMATGRKDAADATALLAAAVRAHPEVADALLPSLDETGRAAVAALRKGAAESLPEASANELPRVLAAPPWLSKTKRKAPPVIEGLAVLSRPESVTLPPPEGPEPTGAGSRLASHEGKSFLFEILDLRGDRPLQVLADLPHERWYLHGLRETLEQLLARFGIRAIAPALEFAPDKPGDVIGALAAVDSTRVAPLMAHGLLRLRSARRDAERWLVAHPETAAAGLVPDALGKPGKARDAAEAALRLLAARGHAAAVRAAAAAHGEAAAVGLDAVLAADPLALGVPARAPRMPEFWRVAALPRPLLAGRKRALPISAVEHLGAMLAFTRHDEPYAGLAEVRAACDPASLHDFAWALFQAWLLAGGPAKDQWAFFALGHLGGDEAARKLAPLVRAWPSEGAFGRAVTGLEVLAVIGSDLALMLLHGIAQKVKSRGLQEKAREKMDAIAAVQGLGADDLADRLVPDLGLDERGSLLLDFGPRSFRVGFDEQLRPFVTAEQREAGGGEPRNKRLADLPKPAKSDDPEKAAAATETWKRVKKDARAVAAAQIARFELALVTRRRWEPEAFVACLVQHPLVGHLTRRLVFGAYAEDGKLTTTFRIAEDRSFAGPADEARALPEGVKVGLVHPLELSPAEAAAWGQVLADYEIVQPFPQLGRETFRATEKEARATSIDRFRGQDVEGAKLFGLDRYGWRRGPVGDGGSTTVYEKEVGGFRAELELTPGLILGAGGSQPEITLGGVTVFPAGVRYGGTAIRVDAMDPVMFSEVVRDLGTLRG